VYVDTVSDGVVVVERPDNQEAITLGFPQRSGPSVRFLLPPPRGWVDVGPVDGQLIKVCRDGTIQSRPIPSGLSRLLYYGFLGFDDSERALAFLRQQQPWMFENKGPQR
jgi:hypothetical protein